MHDPKGAPVLAIHALGIPRFHLGGTQLSFARRKTAAMLLYLSVTRRPHTREALATLFWGDMPQERAMANLRKVLTELRECVDEAVLITRHSVAANPDFPIALDVAAFEAAIDHGIAATDAPLLTRAVQNYTDDFLKGFFLPSTDAFEEWASLYREYLRDRLIAALEVLVTIHSQRGEYRLAFGPARRVVALDPWREEGHRQLMRLLAANGERAAAVAQYQTCRRILAEQLGVEPMPETTALYQHILTDSSSPRHDREQPSLAWPQWHVTRAVHAQAHRRVGHRPTGRSLVACASPGVLIHADRLGGSDYIPSRGQHGREVSARRA